MKEFCNTVKNNPGKSAMDMSFGILLYLLYLCILPFMVLISVLKKTELYAPLKNSHGMELLVFNTDFKPVRYLPLGRSILQRKISLAGTDLYEGKPHEGTLPGLISLHGLRTLSGIDHLGVDKTDMEYLQHSSVMYDIKLIVRYAAALLLSSGRSVYLPRLNLMGVRFMNTTMSDAVAIIEAKAKSREKSNIYFINADTLNKTYEHAALKNILNRTPYVFPDGSGIKIACNMMNMPIRQNINGTDMFPFICKMAEKEGLKIFLYGAKEGVADQMKEKVLKRFPGLQIVGTANGYDLHDNEVINMINHSKADIVLVAKGAPLQEEWIDTHSDKLCAPVVMGVGGLFDFYSESVSRAPIWMREIGLEWIYRLLQEPKRMWRRYLVGNPLFLVRTYLWHKKQKRERMRRYYETVAGEKRLTFIPDLSLVTHRVYPYFKRAVDIIVASIAILLLSPVMLTVAMLIKAESRGPVLFSQKRVGRDGKVFSMYKFRSMVQNAEALKKELAAANESKDGVIFKMKDDPRITKVGKFIRKWSIDELPQLFNVLKGDMSLVGPRPPVPSEVAEYSSEDLKRLHIVPGITCYWQVSGRSEIPFKQQVDLDKKYISTRSLWTDIKILFATIPAVLAQKGAY